MVPAPVIVALVAVPAVPVMVIALVTDNVTPPFTVIMPEVTALADEPMVSALTVALAVKVTLWFEINVNWFTLLILPKVESAPAVIERLNPPPFMAEVESILNAPPALKSVSAVIVRVT